MTLKQLRESKRLTQRALAQELEVTQATISNIENGNIENGKIPVEKLRVFTAQKIARFFGVWIEDLLADG